MPNHCNNTLSFIGSVEDVTRLIETVKSHNKPFSFDKIVPYPQNFKDMDLAVEAYNKEHGEFSHVKAGLVDGYNSGGYEWCSKNWDTKWDAYDFSDTVIENNTISFLTAWSPPINVIRELGKLFPNVELKLEYHELGMNFRGQYTTFQGVEELSDWELTDDDYAELGYDDLIQDCEENC